MKDTRLAAPTVLLAIAGLACTALATNTNETEANETKLLANPVLGMVNGDTITGNTTGTSTTVAGAASADTFRVKTAAAAPGIYRHRLTLSTSGTAGHTGTIRGLNQAAGVPGTTDTTVQTSSSATTPARFNQWYGFGKEEELYYRVTGGTTTTSDYVATLESVPVTPTDVGGTVVEGSVTIKITPGAADTTWDSDFWVYDSNFNAIVDFGHDDADATGVTRTMTAGTYYVAMGVYNTCNNLGSPADDTFRTGAVMDFPNSVVNTSTTTSTTPISIDVTSLGGTVTAPLMARDPFGVVWYRLVVSPPTVPTPPIGSSAATPSAANNCGTGTSLLTVTVTPGQNPVSLTHTVTADLSAIGGSGSQTFYDNGSNGDVTANDNVFSYNATVAAGTLAGAVSMPYTIQETSPQTRSATGNIALTVTECPPSIPPCPSGSTVVQGAMLNSVAAVGGGNGIATNVASGVGMINAIRISGLAEEINEATYASELRARVTTPDGNTYDFSFSTSTIFPIADDYLSEAGQELLVPMQNGDGPWSVEVWESFDDSGIDALWHGICVSAASVASNPTVTNVSWSNSTISGTVGGPFGNDSSLLTATIGPGANPTSTNLGATVDLSGLGGSGTQQMYDDGTHGDVAGGDGVYSYLFTANGTTPLGSFATTVTASDGESRSATGSANLTVGGVTNLGSLDASSTVLQVDDSALGVGEIRWFTFSLACEMNASNSSFLDFDTDGSAIGDTELALYDTSGTMLATDDDGGTGLKSLLTFGTGSGALYDGIAANGVDGAVLAPGSYYLAVGEFNSTFANGFVVTGGDAAGTFDISLHTNLSCGPTCDTIDFNHDDLFPDTQDIDDFLSVFSGGACTNDPNCGDIDFNNDDLFPDTMDIDALLSVFSGGPCVV
ncbi:MAG: choice-of-anchor X domain-containing protein [Phycisphaerales bacterium]